jgi:hypothetical protein
MKNQQYPIQAKLACILFAFFILATLTYVRIQVIKKALRFHHGPLSSNSKTNKSKREQISHFHR